MLNLQKRVLMLRLHLMILLLHLVSEDLVATFCKLRQPKGATKFKKGIIKSSALKMSIHKLTNIGILYFIKYDFMQ